MYTTVIGLVQDSDEAFGEPDENWKVWQQVFCCHLRILTSCLLKSLVAAVNSLLSLSPGGLPTIANEPQDVLHNVLWIEKYGSEEFGHNTQLNFVVQPQLKYSAQNPHANNQAWWWMDENVGALKSPHFSVYQIIL
ncbi:hypothetical protein AMECASPLE_027881 [Ameca splendens]|uniref:Uncharacterized protein n=1 Tax=Ameca splendens TaxID=208324 RepID=A0ABV0YGG7_9TELE